MVDKGLINFIKRKFDAAESVAYIEQTLLKAGFSSEQINEGIDIVKKTHATAHQDIVASNNFLPILNKSNKSVDSITSQRLNKQTRLVGKLSLSSKQNLYLKEPSTFEKVEQHLFSGRLRRRDFIIGFLFFFGLGVVFLCFLLAVASLVTPDITSKILEIVQDTSSNSWLILIPVLLAPITFMLLSIAFRRLHDIDLPGSLSLVLLSFFIPQSSLFHPASVIGLYVVASILFIVMMTKKGINHTNSHGDPLDLKGSLFARILNLL